MLRKILALLSGLSAGVITADPITPIANEYFALNLPGAWTTLSNNENGLWQFSETSGDEMLSVSVLPYAVTPPLEELEILLKQYLDVRRDTESRATQNTVFKLTPVTMHAQNSGVTASYGGHDPETRRRSFMFAIENQKLIIALYYEAYGKSEADFDPRKTAVLGTVKVAE